MKRFVLVSCALVVVSTMAQAQSAEGEISRAVLAAPRAMEADAMVVRLADDGSHEVFSQAPR